MARQNCLMLIDKLQQSFRDKNSYTTKNYCISVCDGHYKLCCYWLCDWEIVFTVDELINVCIIADKGYHYYTRDMRLAPDVQRLINNLANCRFVQVRSQLTSVTWNYPEYLVPFEEVD